MILEPIFKGLKVKEHSYDALRRFFFRRLYLFLISIIFRLRYKSVLLHKLKTDVKFKLKDDSYHWNSLYESILKTNGELDLNIHPPVAVFKLNDGSYSILNGNHRISILQFIHKECKNKKVKVLCGKQKHLASLQNKGYFDFKYSHLSSTCW
jgi:hypothetical protein